jgi:hypothetical protein
MHKKKNIEKFSFGVCLILLSFLIYRTSQAQTSGYILDNSGIQTVNQDYVPQITSSGVVTYSLQSDSFFPLILDLVDLGPVPDENGTPQGTMWKKYGLSSTTSRNTLPELQTAGFNTIWPGFTPNSYEFKLLNQYNMKVLPALESIYPQWIGAQNWQKITDQVNTMKNDPAVLGWYLFDDRDDTETFGAGQLWMMAYVYQAIHNADPNRFIYVAIAGGENAEPTCAHHAYSDVFNVDELWTMSLSTDVKYLLKAKEINNCFLRLGYPTRKPLFTMIQAFRHSNRAIMPSAEQMRAQIYTAVAGGATGLSVYYQHSPWAWKYPDDIPWGQDDPRNEGFSGVSPQVNAAQWNAIAKANNEIGNYKKIFLSKTSTEPYNVYNKNGTVVTMLKDATEAGEPGVKYLLAVNTENKSKDVKIEYLNSSSIDVTSVFNSNTSLSVANGSWTDVIEPYGVRFYKISGAADKIPTCTNALPQNEAVLKTAATRRTYLTGVSNDVTRVIFKVWSEAGWVDDIQTYEARNEGNGVWSYNVPLAEHPGLGNMLVRSYMYSPTAQAIHCGGIDPDFKVVDTTAPPSGGGGGTGGGINPPSSGGGGGGGSTSSIPPVVPPATPPGTVPPASVSSLPTSYNFGTVTLHNGSAGEAVKELQRFLNRILNLGLVVDGKLGPKTIAVIKKWQKDNYLVPDGLIGAKTKAKMNASLK